MANKIIFGADLIDVLENKYNMNKLGEVPTKYKNGVTTVDFIYGKEKNIDDLKYDKPYVEFSIDDETDGFISGTMYPNGVEGIQFDSWEDLKYFMKNAKWTESKKSARKSLKEKKFNPNDYFYELWELNGKRYKDWTVFEWKDIEDDFFNAYATWGKTFFNMYSGNGDSNSLVNNGKLMSVLDKNGVQITGKELNEIAYELNELIRNYKKTESKKSIKEEIDRPTWSKWVVNNIHHIEYFFNGKIVNKKMLNSLFESEGFDTDVDTVEDEIKKAVRLYKLGNLDGNALHIAHNSVGNRIDLVFHIGGLMRGVESLSNDECVIRINGDIYEQDEMWNFGFVIYLTCDVHPFAFALAESKKKFVKNSLKESVDEYIATDEDCNMSGKGWILEGTYNFIMDFLQEWGIAPKDVKRQKGDTYALYNADGNVFGYCHHDDEADIFVVDKTTNWVWENHNPSTKRVKVTEMDEIF